MGMLLRRHHIEHLRAVEAKQAAEQALEEAKLAAATPSSEPEQKQKKVKRQEV